jgi:hypothetical protein
MHNMPDPLEGAENAYQRQQERVRAWDEEEEAARVGSCPRCHAQLNPGEQLVETAEGMCCDGCAEELAYHEQNEER